ncbi:hypothetical protein SEA_BRUTONGASTER_8 [Gordonia phage BrutonGaster]|uniref:Uncharacterized protein n=1 Tax=Gordonia phage BrutonGaster TaxID=2530116 RepID=A0A482JME8_9CAUD|nr:hypothetical protein HOV26_gp008 [Gordonia phage BrutonGaster]QBP33230.1 hypothetical protein SEA_BRUTONGASTER_8 [Gordonia phage BrutonGaster]
MRTLLIGSAAAQKLIPSWRDPKDWDYFSDVGLKFGNDPVRRDVFWHAGLEEILPEGTCRSANLDELYTIKFSHSYWELRNGSWSKHMADLLKMKEAGAQLIPEWHDVLYKIWEDTHGKKVVDLTKEADEFFSDAVKRVYEHDSIHESMAYNGDRPLYEQFLLPGKTVQMDMAAVWDAPLDVQLNMFREEIYVTALERLVIPADYQYSPGRAYQWALRRTITSLTKGRSARFLVEHFDVLARPDINYVKFHLDNKHKLIKLEEAA